MSRIDPSTVRRILDTADIVDVVSDYVQLKRRGSGYIGLCPFHNDRSPSFSVSRSRGYCKCFACGEGGSPVNFLMKIEQVSYGEALRMLAKKYGITIEEREPTDEELRAATERESLLAVNEFAANAFKEWLHDTEDGRNIGLSYLRRRGLTDAMIERFGLGYSLDKRDALIDKATRAGFKVENLVKAGVAYTREGGGTVDRFRGRVIFPVYSVSGRILAFGGRTLRTDKEVAKYVNSPTTDIYSKENELYGLHQARRAIVSRKKAILVEGYLDVISMHQSGMENAVASSGTSLTQGQIHLLRRFTQAVTVVYDSDAAGIKASLRGIDLLLADGLEVRVVCLPEGDDPDSFCQSHTSSEVEEYFDSHEEDFITFMLRTLLQGTENDPTRRAAAITRTAAAVACIPDQIRRQVYISECSRLSGISEDILLRTVQQTISERLRREAQSPRREVEDKNPVELQAQFQKEPEPAAQTPSTAATRTPQAAQAEFLRPFERNLLTYMVRYGLAYFCDQPIDDQGNVRSLRVIDYVAQELEGDEIEMCNPDTAATYAMIREMDNEEFARALDEHRRLLSDDYERLHREGIERIAGQNSEGSIAELHRREEELEAELEAARTRAMEEYTDLYVVRTLTSSEDDGVRRLATDLAEDRHQLSKIHTRYMHIESERERLIELLPRAVYELKDAHLEWRLRSLRHDLAEASSAADLERVSRLLAEQQQLLAIRRDLAKYLGDRVIAPFKR